MELAFLYQGEIIGREGGQLYLSTIGFVRYSWILSQEAHLILIWFTVFSCFQRKFCINEGILSTPLLYSAIRGAMAWAALVHELFILCEIIGKWIVQVLGTLFRKTKPKQSWKIKSRIWFSSERRLWASSRLEKSSKKSQIFKNIFWNEAIWLLKI